MPEIPSSWGLKAKKVAGGTAIVGKDATGAEYVAATCEADGVTDSALEHLALSNRETNTAHDIVRRQMEAQDRVRKYQDDAALESYMEPADMAIRAMTEKPTLGYSRSYARNFDRAFGKEN